MYCTLNDWGATSLSTFEDRKICSTTQGEYNLEVNLISKRYILVLKVHHIKYIPSSVGQLFKIAQVVLH